MLLLAWGGRRQTSEIILPESQADTQGPGEDSAGPRLNTVAVTPETVGRAISILSRPASYSRSQTVETLWSGGGGVSVSQVYVSGGRTRLDTALPDGGVRHTLIEDGVCGVWYDDERTWTRIDSGGPTADAAGRMLTYETVRDLPAGEIATADYRWAFDENCIYVETRPDGAGYADRYWVSVSSGLLISAERLLGDELVYRFSAGEPEISPQEESWFLLPDGGALTERRAA